MPPGILVCGDAADGTVLWQLRLQGPFWATPVLADATVQSDVAQLFEAASQEGGPPPLAVYNAGNKRFRPMHEMDDAIYEELWRNCSL